MLYQNVKQPILSLICLVNKMSAGWKTRLQKYNLEHDIKVQPTIQSGGSITTNTSKINANIREEYFQTITLNGQSYSTAERSGIEMIKNIITLYNKFDEK
jgi:hypothetical protein